MADIRDRVIVFFKDGWDNLFGALAHHAEANGCWLLVWLRCEKLRPRP